MIIYLDDKDYFNTKAKEQFQKRNYILEAFKHVKPYLGNENLICMYMSYWGNLNLHIDVPEIIFSSPSTFLKYYCSSSFFIQWFNLSLFLEQAHTHSLERWLSFYLEYMVLRPFLFEWPSRSLQYSSVLGLLLLIYPLIL